MSLSSSLLREAGGEVEGWGGGGDMTSRPGVRVPQLDPGLVSPFRNLHRVAFSVRINSKNVTFLEVFSIWYINKFFIEKISMNVKVSAYCNTACP